MNDGAHKCNCTSPARSLLLFTAFAWQSRDWVASLAAQLINERYFYENLVLRRGTSKALRHIASHLTEWKAIFRTKCFIEYCSTFEKMGNCNLLLGEPKQSSHSVRLTMLSASASQKEEMLFTQKTKERTVGSRNWWNSCSSKYLISVWSKRSSEVLSSSANFQCWAGWLPPSETPSLGRVIINGIPANNQSD